MAAYRRVYDSRHRQDDAKNRDHLQNPTLGNEYGLPLPYTFFCFPYVYMRALFYQHLYTLNVR